MTLQRIVLLRHGRTLWNHERRMQGRLDPDLDALGWEQAQAVAPAVAAFDPSVLVVSDQRRAWSTARPVATATGLEGRPDPRLRETSLGAWEGRTTDEVEADWPGGIDRWRADPTFTPPGGESRCDVAERAVPVLHDLDDELADVPDATALVVAHGGAIIAMTAETLGWPVASWPTLHPLRNCHWAVLERRDSWQLMVWGGGVWGREV